MGISKLIESLRKAREETCIAADSLDASLRPFEKLSPALFWKPLSEMGVSDKLIISGDFLKLMQSDDDSVE